MSVLLIMLLISCFRCRRIPAKPLVMYATNQLLLTAWTASNSYATNAINNTMPSQL